MSLISTPVYQSWSTQKTEFSWGYKVEKEVDMRKRSFNTREEEGPLWPRR